MSGKFIKAVFLQFTGIMGAGIFVLPYLFYHSDFRFALLSLFVVSLFIAFFNLFYIDIVCRTPGDHQLSGYARIYLGPVFQKITFLNLFILGLGALFAYLQLGSRFLLILFPGLNPPLSLFIYISLVLLFHLSHTKISRRAEHLIPLAGILLVIYLFLNALKSPLTGSGFTGFNFPLIGTLVFALNGFTVIPEVEEALRGLPGKKMLLKLASLAGLALTVTIYILFIIAIIKMSGDKVSSDSLSGLVQVSPFSAKIMSVFGLIVTLEAALNFLLVFKESFFRDLRLPLKHSYLWSSLILLLPMAFFRLPFIRVLSVSGSVTVFVAALIICLIHYRFKLGWFMKVLAVSLPLVFLLSLLLSFE